MSRLEQAGAVTRQLTKEVFFFVSKNHLDQVTEWLCTADFHSNR